MHRGLKGLMMRELFTIRRMRLLEERTGIEQPPVRLLSKELVNGILGIRKGVEEYYPVRRRNNPDEFGGPAQAATPAESDIAEDKHWEDQPAPGTKLRTVNYAALIKGYVRRRQVKEALDVFEERMKQDRVKPEAYIYNLLMGMCGRVGYTKKAFSLYNDMKKRGLKATGGTYTALFNACANSPWPEDGLKRATHLKNIMLEKQDQPNITNYNAMIKAFGRTGDLQTAFSLVDEMIEKRQAIRSDTINFLLQACIQDKEAGFRHALLIWRKTNVKRISPDLYTFNLLLRCIRDCGIGDIDVMTDTLTQLLGPQKVNVIEGEVKLLDNGQTKLSKPNFLTRFVDVMNKTFKPSRGAQKVDLVKAEVKPLDNVPEDLSRPNLLARVPHLGNILSLAEIKKPEDRLLLVGGMKGFLELMKERGCSPDVKTFTQLLDCIPGSEAAEKELQAEMKHNNVRPDIDFLNMLIKRRSIRSDYEGAKSVLKEMQKLHYKPNILTYGVLALSCDTLAEAQELIDDMKAGSYRLNTEILGTMLYRACHNNNFRYIHEVMEISKREEVRPNEKFMSCLERFRKKAKKISNDNTLSESVEFQKDYRLFRTRYKTWMDEIEVDETEKAHPWTQFRQKNQTDVRHYREKAVRFKAKHTSLYRVKTSRKYIK